MRNIFILSLLSILLSGCLTTKKTSESHTHEKAVSFVMRDSVVIRDSVVVQYNTIFSDSVVVRDSVVIVLDHLGGVVSREKYKNVESYKNSATERDSNVSHDTAKVSDVQKEEKEATASEKVVKKSAVPVFVQAFVGIAIIAFMILAVHFMERKD